MAKKIKIAEPQPNLNRAERRRAQRNITNNGKIERTFSYAKKSTSGRDVNLNFTLRIDMKGELIAFLELMEVAVNDLKEEIAKK